MLVLDGAGDFEATTTAFQEAVRADGAPLWIDAVHWSHGYGRILADQIDQDHICCAGQALAARITAYHQKYPRLPIHLVGHSAGSAVVLAAAAVLPPNSVDHIVLLAPSVSADYDVRPALRCACGGVDVFYSQRDVAYLGLGTGIFGTTDRRWTPAAGRVGFRVAATSAEDAALLARLRQHPWNASVVWTGNEGGHYGSHHVCYLRAYVLPLFAGP
jgi:pimeloyl-ACP methyl ester carboxylesterase